MIECRGDEGNDSMVTGHALDLGMVVKEARGSLENLKHLASIIPDLKRFQYLSSHFRPSASESLHSHPVTKSLCNEQER
jgi:hypothetical protein